VFWFARPENFPNKRNVFRRSQKFPTELSKRKIVFQLPFSNSSRSCTSSQTSSRLSLNESELHEWQMLISNGISHSGGLAYHLHTPWTNQFPHVNGKQPWELEKLCNCLGDDFELGSVSFLEVLGRVEIANVRN